jgi:hypothetical protein
MINSNYPLTDKPFTDFFPQGLFSNRGVQAIYLKSLRDPGLMKFGYNWLYNCDQPTSYAMDIMLLNKLNLSLLKDTIIK